MGKLTGQSFDRSRSLSREVKEGGAFLQNLGGDADGDFLGGVAGHGEADGGVEAIDGVLRDAGIGELAADAGEFCRGPHDADIGEGAAGDAKKGADIVVDICGHDDHVGPGDVVEERAGVGVVVDGDGVVNVGIILEGEDVGAVLDECDGVAEVVHGAGEGAAAVATAEDSDALPVKEKAREAPVFAVLKGKRGIDGGGGIVFDGQAGAGDGEAPGGIGLDGVDDGLNGLEVFFGSGQEVNIGLSAGAAKAGEGARGVLGEFSAVVKKLELGRKIAGVQGLIGKGEDVGFHDAAADGAQGGFAVSDGDAGAGGARGVAGVVGDEAQKDGLVGLELLEDEIPELEVHDGSNGCERWGRGSMVQKDRMPDRVRHGSKMSRRAGPDLCSGFLLKIIRQRAQPLCPGPLLARFARWGRGGCGGAGGGRVPG